MENKNLKSIEKEVFSFYSDLYSSHYSLKDADTLCDKIKNSIPHIEESFKVLCESDLRIEFCCSQYGSKQIPRSRWSYNRFLSILLDGC